MNFGSKALPLLEPERFPRMGVMHARMLDRSTQLRGKASGISFRRRSALPEQHEDQLQLGFRMIQNAYNNKMQSLEQEVRSLRMTCEEQKSQATQLQRKNSQLEAELVDGHHRSQQLADENKELFKTVNQLKKQLARLDALKSSVLASIADHNQSDVDTDDSKLYMRDEYLKGAMPLTMAAHRGETPASMSHVGKPASPAPLPRAVSPQPQQGADPGQPIDGKAFFRKARNSLSYEAFNEFLANIKQLNNQQQTREETLDSARRIFGPEQQHLYKEFEQLLNRHAGGVGF